MFKVNGPLIENAPIGQQSWFRCGGSADLLFQPNDVDDLASFLGQYPYDQPITLIGGLANTIIRDGGIRGVTIQLGKPFAEIKHYNTVIPGLTGDLSYEETDPRTKAGMTPTVGYLEVGAGALNGSVAAAAMKAGIGGMEFLSGIPGSLGGAMAMNAGAYGSEVKDVLVGITVMTRSGEIQKLTADQLRMSYRKTEFPEWVIVLSAVLKGQKEPYETVKSRLTEIKKKRNDTQPISEKTGGSTFANPRSEDLRRAGLSDGTCAWEIVEMVDGRGLTIGGAQMSEKHCNFMINTGNANAADLEALGDEVKNRALKKFGVDLLHWEIKRIGEKA